MFRFFASNFKLCKILETFDLQDLFSFSKLRKEMERQTHAYRLSLFLALWLIKQYLWIDFVLV